MKNGFNKVILASALAMGSIVSSFAVTPVTKAAAATETFKDIKGHWAYSSIMEGVQKGYLNGMGNGVFKPNDPVTVAQFLTMVLKSLATKDNTGNYTWSASTMKMIPEWQQRYFKDSSISFDTPQKGLPWYANIVRDAKVLYIIREEYEGRYSENLTRERASAIIDAVDSYLHGTITDNYADQAGPLMFKDNAKIEGGFKRTAAKTALRGIMVGNPGGYFNPKAAISRAEAAKITAVLNNEKVRQPQKVDMSKMPYTMVEARGYAKTPFVFANWEMKKLFDTLKSEQKSYAGITGSDYAVLNYYNTNDDKDKHIQQMYYFQDNFMDFNIYYDLSVGFYGNAYTLNLKTTTDSVSRSSDVLGRFLAQIFKDKSAAQKLISASVGTDQAGGYASENQTIEGRQVVINSTGHGYLAIGISAYADKK